MKKIKNKCGISAKLRELSSMRNKLRKYFQLPAATTMACLFFFSGSLDLCWSQEQTAKNVTAPAGDKLAGSYSYVAEGRPDPFRPFLSPKTSTSAGLDPNEIVEENAKLSGMQLFEPGQLTLVGILMAGKNPMAMVEDQTKKGYLLKLGMPIGKRGVITQIEKQQVVITETARTRAGKEINSTVILRLKQEGDK